MKNHLIKFLFRRGCMRRWKYLRLCRRSLFYNHHLNNSFIYASDVAVEPLLRLVENYTHLFGPVGPLSLPVSILIDWLTHSSQIFVVGVILLTFTVVYIAYWIGLPYWWALNRPITIILLIIGNWLLLNVTFHYYKAVVTPAGVSPSGGLIASAASICKKCIAPRAARVHHCSVCQKCILKMDHHCREYKASFLIRL